jgi:hypothetical protein
VRAYATPPRPASAAIDGKHRCLRGFLILKYADFQEVELVPYVRH